MRRSRSTAGAAKTRVFARVAAVLVAAAALVCAPGIAQAAFSGGDSGSTAVGTISLPAPTGANVVASCVARSLSIVVTSYGTVPRATSYDFVVLNPGGGSMQTGADGTYVKATAAKGTWTYQIHGLYTAAPGNVWISQPFQGTVTC